MIMISNLGKTKFSTEQKSKTGPESDVTKKNHLQAISSLSLLVSSFCLSHAHTPLIG